MTAIGCALALGFALAYDLARRVITLRQPLPPHEELVAKVAALEQRVNSVETWAKR